MDLLRRSRLLRAVPSLAKPYLPPQGCALTSHHLAPRPSVPSFAGSSPFGASSMANIRFPFFTQVREYRSNKAIDFVRIKEKQRALDLMNKKVKLKNHAGVLQRFRLTRFGWERRRAGLHAQRKCRMTRKSKKEARRIDYVHRLDIHKVERCVPSMRLKIRDPPCDMNPNIRPIMRHFPCYFG
eukprot:GEMP01052480.1.p1 GENE.GEMP01052480.1~~GEMP01052480.1.p1  ORF type:complete len:183 (+),score=35.15 GEMP01052480.1:241-789(+)